MVLEGKSSLKFFVRSGSSYMIFYKSQSANKRHIQLILAQIERSSNTSVSDIYRIIIASSFAYKSFLRHCAG